MSLNTKFFIKLSFDVFLTKFNVFRLGSLDNYKKLLRERERERERGGEIIEK